MNLLKDFQFFLCFFPDSEAEQRYNKLLERVGTAISIDVNLSKLLTYCMLFLTEFDDHMEERNEIRAIQETMVRMLQRYIYARFPRQMAVQLFAKVLHCIHDLQELTWIKKQRSMAIDSRSVMEEEILTDANKPRNLNQYRNASSP